MQARFRELGREIAQQVYNAFEPKAIADTPPRVRVGSKEYRRHRRTEKQVATLFGTITLWRTFYQATEAGERGLAPLEYSLGIVAGLATPALADAAARLQADLPQEQTCQVLGERHEVHWSHGSLRKVVAKMAEVYAPHRHEAQVERLIDLLRNAATSRGKHRFTIAVGRDGLMLPMRPSWEEGACASITVHDRRGQRIGSVYLGRMPEFGQGTLTNQLTRLLNEVLSRWQGKLPRLHYVTDAGWHPQHYFRHCLSKMKHPRTGEKLHWEWIVDYYHACERITMLAECLFGSGREAEQWAKRMRDRLKTKSRGVLSVLRSAQAFRRERGLKGSRKNFAKACNYLKKYAPHMDYAKARQRKLPIGSGVTEAACKTIFTWRFKQSGMSWMEDQGQRVLDLRVIQKSNVWSRVRLEWFNRFTPCFPVTPALQHHENRMIPENKLLPA